MEAPYPEGYIAIQVALARTMAQLLGASLVETLRTYTSLYKIVGAPGDFDPAEPMWRALAACVDGEASAAEQARALHRFYLRRYADIPKFGDERHWGCFAYERRPSQRALRLHFSNEDASGAGPLSRERSAVRREELRAMLGAARREEVDAVWILGGSWLYNLDAYRRLFPPSFGASATPDEPHIQYRALWGQFLRHDMSLNTARADDFLARVTALGDPRRYADCFPLQVLLTRAPIAEFYSFFDV